MSELKYIRTITDTKYLPERIFKGKVYFDKPVPFISTDDESNPVITNTIFALIKDPLELFNFKIGSKIEVEVVIRTRDYLDKYITNIYIKLI